MNVVILQLGRKVSSWHGTCYFWKKEEMEYIEYIEKLKSKEREIHESYEEKEINILWILNENG